VATAPDSFTATLLEGQQVKVVQTVRGNEQSNASKLLR
jgi:hypothetical protein